MGRGTRVGAAGSPRASTTARHRPVPGPRCAAGGLRELLRGQLAKVADGVRAHLPPSAPATRPRRGTHVLGLAVGCADGLGDLPGLDKLRDLLGSPGGVAGARPGPALPGKTRHAVHRGAAGARPYTLYVPTTGTGPRPLVVMLHGGTQTAADFAAATRHERTGRGARVPRRLPRAGHLREPDAVLELVRARPTSAAAPGEPSILAGIVDEIAAEHGVDRDRVYVAGFSAGGGDGRGAGRRYPDVFAAVGVHSGLPHGSATDLASAFAAMRAGRRGRGRWTGRCR